jgi:DNA-binding NtrC family response regulator
VPDQGTKVRVSLPSFETEFISVQAIAPVAVEPALESRVATVLLLEEEHPLREAVSKAVRKAGGGVTEAADGSVALDVIRDKQRPIDVLILDTTIPKISSWEVLAECKSLRPEMKVFVTSAYP